jgi:hypothetical protein
MVKFVFIRFCGLYGAMGLCLGGFVRWFLGMKIVDKWFYFQSFNVFLCLDTITGFWEGQDVGCVRMVVFYVCNGGSFWWVIPIDMSYCAPLGLRL